MNKDNSFSKDDHLNSCKSPDLEDQEVEIQIQKQVSLYCYNTSIKSKPQH